MRLAEACLPAQLPDLPLWGGRTPPPVGQLSVEDVATMVLCKPKLLPLKSVTLEKLEKMQRAAQETIRQQEVAQKEQQQQSE
nr:BBSome-interacting protein 1 isoform X1 [Caretta caretta]